MTLRAGSRAKGKRVTRQSQNPSDVSGPYDSAETGVTGAGASLPVSANGPQPPSAPKPMDCAGCPLAQSGIGFVPLTYLSAPAPEQVLPVERIRLLVQAEAPGKNEAREGAALIGDAGFWARHNILRNAGVLDSECLLDNTLRCLPPMNRNGEHYPVGETRRAAEQHCRRYDAWDHFPGKPLLLFGGKAMGVVLGCSEVGDWHGHVEFRNGRVVGATYHPAAVMRQPNLLPVTIREVANLLEAARNPAVLRRPTVLKGAMLDLGGEMVFDFEWHPKTNVLTAMGIAYDGDLAYSSYDVGYGLDILRRKLEAGERVVGHNIIDADFPRVGMVPQSWAPTHVIDTMIVAHLVHAHFSGMGLLDLGGLTRFYAPTSNWKHDMNDLLLYNGFDCAYNFRLWKALERDLTVTDQWHLVGKQQRLAALSQRMHERGVRLDAPALAAYWEEREENRREFREHFPINPNSPAQIIEWAATLGIRIGDARHETLEKHRGINADFDRLIDYRDDVKSLKTWFPFETGRKGNLVGVGEWVYPRFHVTGTDVGRFSCSDPNYQNLPPYLRRFIIPRSPDLEIVAFDFSQLENRTVAWASGDTEALELWSRGFDPYRLTAAMMFNVRYEAVTAEQRASAKVTELASLYGETEYSLARRVFGNQKRESVLRARELQSAYFRGRPRVREWQKSVVRQLDSGNVILRNPFGRVRFVYARNSHERLKRGCHFIGCSTGADWVNQCALDIADDLRRCVGELSMPILMVHDELVFELPKGDIKARRQIKALLERPVPQLGGLVLSTKCKAGPNYGSLVEVEDAG